MYARLFDLAGQVYWYVLSNIFICLHSWPRHTFTAMMGIHRTFFIQALLDHPTNPLKSPYAPSFLAATRCASVVVKSFLYHCERAPSLYSRFWNMWTHAFTACVRKLVVLLSRRILTGFQVILGSTVARCPAAAMAPSALTELDHAVSMFEKGSEYSLRARQAYVSTTTATVVEKYSLDTLLALSLHSPCSSS